MNPTDTVLLRELEYLTETHGVCRLSTRQLAELTGITRHTVGRSLSRLAAAGRIIKVRDGYGNTPAHWVARGKTPPGIRSVPLARNVPRHTPSTGTPDMFRRRDLRGPGALFDDLPDSGVFTAEQVLGYTRLTTRVRTVERWLMVLGSLPWPLVDETQAEDGQVLWLKNHVEDWQQQENADHLTAVGGGWLPLKTRSQMELQHQLERAGRMFPRGAAA